MIGDWPCGGMISYDENTCRMVLRIRRAKFRHGIMRHGT